MFGFLKNVIGKRAAADSPVAGSPAPMAIPVPAPVPVAVSVPAVARPVEARVGGAVPRFSGRMERVLLNLKSITDRFPSPLRSVIAQNPAPGVIVAVSVDSIVDQLPSGRVRIPLGDLRKVAPAVIFFPDTSRDEELVEIPLGEILPKLDPSLLERNSRRVVDLPDGVEGVFESKIRGRTQEPVQVQWSGQPGATQPVSEIYSIDIEEPVESPWVPELPEVTPEPAIPEPSVSPIVEPVAPPVEREPDGTLAAPEDLRALFSKAAKPEEVPVPTPPPADVPAPEPIFPDVGFDLKLEGEGTSPNSGSPPPSPAGVVPEPEPEPPVEQAAPAPVSAVPTPAPEEGAPIRVPLSMVSELWPEGIRDEIATLPPETTIHFPMKELGSVLKRGAVNFTWSRLRSWVVPAAPGETMYDVAILNIPVSVVAPLFMAASRQARPVNRVELPENIPAPFAPEPKKPAPAPVPESPAGAVVARKPVTELPAAGGRVPADIVNRASALNGVAGAIVASSEGLLVAAKLPPELDAETMAAFLPQVFARLEQVVEPMRIGDLKSVVFTTDDRPWLILRAGGLYLAAMGRPNELLPNAQLKMLAGQLARQVKP